VNGSGWRRWLMVAGLFVILLVVFGGGYNTVPIFLPALLKAFPAWSRQRVSILPSVLAISAGLFILPVGWLVDRIEAALLMISGTLAAGIAFLIAAHADGLTTLIGAYLLLGYGIAAGTVLPAAYVIANWFHTRRGLAMGLANSGSTLGGMVMTLAAGYVLFFWGWRAAYMTIGLAMIVLGLPIIGFGVRSRPPSAQANHPAKSATLPGYEVRAALRQRSFWMIALANFCFAFSATGTAIHLVAHLEGVRYAAVVASLAMSLVFGFATLGKVMMGLLADRTSARFTLALVFAIQAVGVALLLTLGRPGAIAFFIPIYGISVAAPLMLLPLLTAESMGLKRFGAISGCVGLAQTFGAAIAPLVSGRIFDLTGSYAAAFELFIAINLLGALAAYACRVFGSENAPPLAITAPASL
jgi:sugar phosphate permease